jgi:hypothetical protein
MNKVGELLMDFAQKVGLDPADERLKAVAGITTELDVEIAEKITKGLMTVDAAIANDRVYEAVKSKFTPGFEQSFFEQISLILDKEQVAEVKAHKETGARMREGLTKVKALTEKLKEAKTDGADKDALKDLQFKLAAANKSVEDLNATILNQKSQFENQLKDYDLGNKLNSYRDKINWNDAIAPELRDVVFKTSLNSKLAEIGGALHSENGSLTLRKSSDTTAKVFDSNNREVTLESLVSLVIQEKGLAKTGNANLPKTPVAHIPAMAGDKPTKAQSMNFAALNKVLSDVK